MLELFIRSVSSDFTNKKKKNIFLKMVSYKDWTEKISQYPEKSFEWRSESWENCCFKTTSKNYKKVRLFGGKRNKEMRAG